MKKLKSDRVMADLALAFQILPLQVTPKAGQGAYVRFVKKSCAAINKYFLPFWCDPANFAKVQL